MAVSPGQAVLSARIDSLKLLKLNLKLNLWSFYITGPEHHEHPHLMHKNETSVAGEVWAHPMAGKVSPSPLQALFIRGSPQRHLQIFAEWRPRPASLRVRGGIWR